MHRIGLFAPLFLLAILSSCDRDMRRSEDLDKLGKAPAGQAPVNSAPAVGTQPTRKPLDLPVWRIPAGASIKVKNAAGLSTRTAAIGDRFKTTVTQPVAVEGVTVIPAGAEAGGLVFATSDGGGLRRKVEMELRLVNVKLPGDRVVDIRTLSLLAARSTDTGNAPVVIEAGTEMTFQFASEARIPKQ